jgi:hypothetical protein
MQYGTLHQSDLSKSGAWGKEEQLCSGHQSESQAEGQISLTDCQHAGVPLPVFSTQLQILNLYELA